MKKALTISIAGTVFTIEEDAYQILDEYLQSIKNYFGHQEDSKEIINDIEARIAERFLERSNATGPVTLDDVNNMISIMGRVEDFEGSTSSNQTEQKANYQGPRRLYRNPDDIWVMGVASGIAAYFGIDPLLTRLGFIILTFITGFFPGIVIYFILALIIPSAETSAQKMQMRGGPANLQSFKESMNEYSANIKTEGKHFGEKLKNTSNEFAANIKKSASGLKEQWKHHDHHESEKKYENARPEGIVQNRPNGLVGLIRSMVRLVFKLVGFAIKLVATLAIILAVFVFIALVFHFHPFNTFPIAEVMSWPMYYVVITLVFLAAILPLSLLSLIGNVVMLRGKPKELYGAIGIIGTWFGVLLVIFFLGLSYGPTIRNRINALPQYQQATKTFDVKDFKNITVHGAANVHITEGKDYSIIVSGLQQNIDGITAHLDADTVVFDETDHNNFCFFCMNIGDNRLKYEITAPAIHGASLSGASSISGTMTSTSTVNLKLQGASSANLTVVAPETHLDASGASRITLTGSSANVNLNLEGASRFNGQNFISTTTTVEAYGASRANVNVSSVLNVSAHGASRILYYGSPKVTSEISGASRVESAEQNNTGVLQ